MISRKKKIVLYQPQQVDESLGLGSSKDLLPLELLTISAFPVADGYEVEILDGAAVKRVLSASMTNAVYTAAQQTADWGTLLGPGDTLDIRIYQLSALVGRGAPKTVTLTF